MDAVVSVQISNCIWRYKSTGEIAVFIALNVAGYIHTYIHIHILFGEAGLFVATHWLVWTCQKIPIKHLN